MTESLKDLLQQKDLLDKKIAEQRRIEISDALANVRNIVAQYELSVQDVFPTGRGGARVSAAAGTKVAPKYRNPSTGETWTGRGKAPKWIQDQDRTQFAI